MSIFEKKKDVKRRGPANVYMPQKRSARPTIANKKRTGSINSNGKPLKRPRRPINTDRLKKVLVIILSIIFSIGLIYLFLVFVINLRKQKPTDIITENVVGLADIPAFPGSNFIFKDDIDNPSVSTFITSGNSAYKIPSGKNIDDVYKFYQEQLPKKGWTFVLTAPIASDTMRSGEYWTKENAGLRIYTKYNDVWYETITKMEAENGLAEKVKEEVERDLLLANEDAQDLLPDFPWVLKVSREYVVTYSVAPYESMRTLEMKKLGSEEKVVLTPIDKYHGGGLDTYLDKYIQFKNSEGKDICGIQRTVAGYTPYSTAVKGEISCNDGIHGVAVFVDPNKGITYILDTNQPESPFFEEVLTNLKPQDTTRH